METHVVVAGLDDWQTAVEAAERRLSEGEVVALPTETVYGLAADALNPEAVAKVFAVKERPEFDPLIVHVSGLRDLARVAHMPRELEDVVGELAKAFWPGALTLVLPKCQDVPDIVTAGLPTVAVRVSSHEVMRAITKRFGPVAAPSANKFGRISPTSASAVMAELGGEIPLIVDGGACKEGLESTIVAPRLVEQRVELRLLRPGPVPREELRKYGKVTRVRPLQPGQNPETPGQLASHYAPRRPLFLYENPEEFVPEEGKVYALLSYRGSEKDGYAGKHPWKAVEVLSPGKGKLGEAAVRFFHCLRRLDESGVDAIVAEPISETGLGVAMMDRLRRASTAYGS